MSSAAILTNKRALRCVLLATNLLLSVAGTARAQGAAASDTQAISKQEQAARLFEEALAAYDRGEMTSAIEKLRAANALAPSARVLYNLAVFEAAAGQPMQAAVYFERYLASEDAAQSPVRQQSVRRALDELRKQLVRVQFTTEPATATVIVDGSDAERSLLLEPGAHRVRVEAAGFVPSELALETVAGEQLKVVVQLAPLPTPAAPPVAAAKRFTHQPAHLAPQPKAYPLANSLWSARTWAIALIGGGAALAAGAGAAYLASNNEQDDWSTENDRLDSIEPPSRDDAYWLARSRNAERSRKIRQLEGIGIGLLIGGATAVATGAGIWITSPKRSQGQAAGLHLSGTW
jgi:hypothetical protein